MSNDNIRHARVQSDVSISHLKVSAAEDWGRVYGPEEFHKCAASEVFQGNTSSEEFQMSFKHDQQAKVVTIRIIEEFWFAATGKAPPRPVDGTRDVWATGHRI